MEADLAAAPAKEQLWESEPYEIDTIVTEFSVLKKRDALPRQGDDRPRHLNGPRRHARVAHARTARSTTLTQEYSKYEFFSVRTEEEVWKLINEQVARP
jgi:hypothetical protein